MPRWKPISFFLVLVVLNPYFRSVSGEGIENLADQLVDIRVMEGESTITFRITDDIELSEGRRSAALSPGVYTVQATKARAARQRYHLFAKTFQPGQNAEQQAYLKSWRARGYSPEAIMIGKRLQTESGKILDSRVHWISIVQTATESEAKATQAKLKAANQWTWMQGEIIAPGTGEFRIVAASGRKEAGTFPSPLRVTSRSAVAVSNVDVGFWEEKQQHVAYSGNLEFGIGPDGKIELVERLPVESYIQGVLPAEMPPLWPAEALKAQAVAARSEVLMSMATKHRLEGFDFCGVEHCRAYVGSGGRSAQTDAAVRATQGQILVQGARIIPAVFSSDCGGWTEDNETPWRAPPDAALRGISDLVRGTKGVSPAKTGVEQWLKNPPASYCAGDQKYFRWTRKYSQRELSELLNKRHAVGTVKSITLGDRGISGRLKRLRVSGSKKTETIEKELPIRLAFGGLPSALFVVETSKGRSGALEFTIRGGGRGHGVGMCQHGAKGMASAGIVYTDILRHYYSEVAIERYR